MKSPGCYGEMEGRKKGEKGKTTQLWRGGDPAEEEGEVRAARASHSAAFGAGPEGFPSARALRAGREDAPGAGISRIRDELGPWKAGTMACPGSSRPAAAAGAAGIPTTGMKPPCRPRLGARGGIRGGEKPEKTGKIGGEEKGLHSSLRPQRSSELGGSRTPFLEPDEGILEDLWP